MASKLNALAVRFAHLTTGLTPLAVKKHRSNGVFYPRARDRGRSFKRVTPSHKKNPHKAGFFNGGSDEARTRDLLRDRQAL